MALNPGHLAEPLSGLCLRTPVGGRPQQCDDTECKQNAVAIAGLHGQTPFI